MNKRQNKKELKKHIMVGMYCLPFDQFDFTKGDFALATSIEWDCMWQTIASLVCGPAPEEPDVVSIEMMLDRCFLKVALASDNSCIHPIWKSRLLKACRPAMDDVEYQRFAAYLR